MIRFERIREERKDNPYNRILVPPSRIR